MNKGLCIGLVVMRNSNLGNNLTNYALYQYLKECGHTVYLIDSLYRPHCERFLHEPIPEEAIFKLHKDEEISGRLNEMCDMFIVGSDQLWRGNVIEKLMYHSVLSWVNGNKYMMSYGTSMGVDFFDAGENVKKKTQYYLNRFQAISVREASSVDMLDKEFGVRAELVLDPVFLCDKKNYMAIIDSQMINLAKCRYVAAYVLDPDAAKVNAIKRIADWTNIDTIRIITEQRGKFLELCPDTMDVTESFTVENWIAHIAGSEYVLTDSFHGMCLAILFEKQFVVLYHKESWRGLARITDLLKRLDLEERLIESEAKIDFLFENSIDYNRVNKKLQQMKEKSAFWLDGKLREQESYKGGLQEYDMISFFLNPLQRTIQEKSDQLELLRKGLEEKCIYDRREFIDLCVSIGRPVTTIFWGAGDCLKRNIEILKKFSDSRVICDNSSGLWGQEIEGYYCISPEEISSYENVEFVITVDNKNVADTIREQINSMGYDRVYSVHKWLSFYTETPGNDGR